MPLLMPLNCAAMLCRYCALEAVVAGRKVDYLFLRKGSRNWHLKLQYPGELAQVTGQKRIEKSLGTPDRAVAEIIALPFIREHKLRLLQAWPDLGIKSEWHHQFEPGREHIGTDGGRIIATDNELIYLDADGAIVKTAQNIDLTIPVQWPSLGQQRAFVRREDAHRRTVNDRTEDGIIETYLKHANVGGYNAREARSTWDLYKELTQNKPLKEATRDDGRKVVEFFANQGVKSATIKKKIGWLNAAVNLAINESQLKFNPFSKIVPKLNDKKERLPLSEADIKNARNTLDQLNEHDQLLFRILASTGMRLSEAFEIDGEFRERGCRYVIIGTKSPQSKRRVPLPAAVLPYVPKNVGEALFQGGARAASKRLNLFLNEIGITDSQKVVHSLRHRAQDRLRAASCPIDYRWALLGHEKKTVAEGYGLGFPVPLLKRWIDKIGF